MRVLVSDPSKDEARLLSIRHGLNGARLSLSRNSKATDLRARALNGVYSALHHGELLEEELKGSALHVHHVRNVLVVTKEENLRESPKVMVAMESTEQRRVCCEHEPCPLWESKHRT